MKYTYFAILFSLCLISCTAKEVKGVAYDAKVFDLNGTWEELSQDPKFAISDKEIAEYRKKVLADQSMEQKYSWGVGRFNVNGSWYFDITDANHLFYDGFLLYEVVSEKKTSTSTIDIGVVVITKKEQVQNDSKVKTDNREIAHLLITFLEEDKIEIRNQDKMILLDSGPIYLYRLSGPKMMGGK